MLTRTPRHGCSEHRAKGATPSRPVFRGVLRCAGPRSAGAHARDARGVRHQREGHVLRGTQEVDPSAISKFSNGRHLPAGSVVKSPPLSAIGSVPA